MGAQSGVTPTVPDDWYRSYFGPSYRRATAEYASPQRTRREVAFLLDHWQVMPGARVLDVCCGHGRHALRLARRGLHVTGIDLDPTALARLRRAAARHGLCVDTIEADVSDVRLPGRFDAACWMFHSFGYLPTDEANRQSLCRVARELRRRARLVLQVPNRERVFIDARYDQRERLSGDVRVILEHRIDLRAGRLEGIEHRVTADGRRRTRVRSIRIFSLAEYAGLAESAGLVIEAAYGGPDGARYEVNSPELLLVLRRR